MKQCVSGWYIIIEVAEKVFQNKIFTREQHVHELTVSGSAAHLLDLPQLGVEAVVNPGQHLVPAK